MARFTSAALALLLCLTQSPLTSAATTLIDSTGALTRAPISESSLGNGIVAVLSSPGTPSFFTAGEDGVTIDSYNGVSVLSSPGATLSGTSPLSKGNGASAAAAVSGSIIISGITESDLENGLDDTRHGQTLTGIFKQKIKAGGDQVTLIVAVPVDVDGKKVVSDVKHIFDAANAEVGSDAQFDDLYAVSVEIVENEADAQRVSGQ